MSHISNPLAVGIPSMMATTSGKALQCELLRPLPGRHTVRAMENQWRYWLTRRAASMAAFSRWNLLVLLLFFMLGGPLGCGALETSGTSADEVFQITNYPGASLSARDTGSSVVLTYYSGPVAVAPSGWSFRECDLSPFSLEVYLNGVLLARSNWNNGIADPVTYRCGGNLSVSFLSSDFGSMQLRVIHPSLGNDISVTVDRPPPPATCRLVASREDVPNGGTTNFTISVGGYYPAGSTAYWAGTRNGTVDAVSDPVGGLSGTWTITNSAGVDGHYTRRALIKNASGVVLCRTNDVNVWFRPVYSISTEVKSSYANKCLTDNGGNAVIWDCGSAPNQNWAFGSDNTVTIVGRCLDVYSSGTSNGTRVQTFECNGTDAQVWIKQTDGSLLNPNSGKCLDVLGWASTNGSRLGIWDCNGLINQQWVAM